MATFALVWALALALASRPEADQSASAPRMAEHRYRIEGKVRLLLFWATGDEVGGARVTWRDTGADAHAFSLLIGTNPQRAPRGINEWGYFHESVDGNQARVLGVRTVTDPASPEAARTQAAVTDDRAVFAMICSDIAAHEARSSIATFRAPRDVSYDRFDRLLDAIGNNPSSESRQVARPDAAAPGFLTALDRAMRASGEMARAGRPPSAIKPVAYVYKDAVFDLSIRRAEPLPQLQSGTEVHRNLVRADFRVRNRRTNEPTDFTMTFGVDGELAAVPIQAAYQPNWWLKIQLVLSDRFDVPADPRSDDLLRQRMDSLCAQTH